ncbi:hypothetical protein KUCAC02_037033, partial [Chaenocephalus aceratus]
VPLCTDAMFPIRLQPDSCFEDYVRRGEDQDKKKPEEDRDGRMEGERAAQSSMLELNWRE